MHGHHGSVLSSHRARTPSDSAAFLLPHLDREADLLDIGCGPGSITRGLAAIVGTAIGIDPSHEAIEEARTSDPDHRVGWLVASGEALPFSGGSFDVVFGHQVLQHVADPVLVLTEARRVLRPGGIVAVRDADYGTMVHHPHDPRLDRWLDLYHRVADAHAGDPHAGRKLAAWVRSAGFETVAVTTSTWTYTTDASVEAWRDLWVGRLLEARLGDAAIRLGLADRSELEDLADAWRRWAAHPDAFFAFLHGEVVARRI